MRQQLLISTAVLVLSTSLPALAQNSPAFGNPPTRIANTYNWQHHQPTQQDVGAAESATGERPSSQTFDKVQKEVEALLKQTDDGVRQANEVLGVYSRAGARASR